MFENAGSKLKTLAVIFFVIGLICCFISGISIMLAGNGGFLVGFLIIALGALSCWISSLVMYALGEYTENTEYIRQDVSSIKRLVEKNTANGTTSQEAQSAPSVPNTRKADSSKGEWKCVCGEVHQSYVTSCYCGKSKREALKENKSE